MGLSLRICEVRTILITNTVFASELFPGQETLQQRKQISRLNILYATPNKQCGIRLKKYLAVTSFHATRWRHPWSPVPTMVCTSINNFSSFPQAAEEWNLLPQDPFCFVYVDGFIASISDLMHAIVSHTFVGIILYCLHLIIYCVHFFTKHSCRKLPTLVRNCF